jgi:hypothetical protein
MPVLTAEPFQCIDVRVSQGLSFISRTRFLAVVVLASAGSLLHANGQGNKTMPIRVQDSPDPLKHASFPDDLDSRRIFSATNPMANKTFMPNSTAFKTDSDFTDKDRNTFVTKRYIDPNAENSSSNLAGRPFPTSGAFMTRAAAGYDKAFPTSSDDQEKHAFMGLSSDSDDQNRTAHLEKPGNPIVLASNSMSNKTYLGPGAQRVPDGLAIKDNIILSRMSGIPDRPLSIDEVRNLINHGTKPDTSVPPPAPSKALNDPGYRPEPLREMPVPDSDDDKNDPVPPPGTMAAPPAPENAEPLPQH